MAAEFTNILSASIGTAEFQLTGFSPSDQPVLKDGWQVGHTVTVDLEGYIQGADATDLQGKLAAFLAAAPAPKNDLIIKGMGGKTLYSLLSAKCVSSGPHVKVKQSALRLDQLRAEFQIQVTGETSLSASEKDKSGGGGNNIPQGTSISYAVRTDGLQDVAINGEARGADAAAQIASAVAEARTAFPWPNYRVTYSTKKNLPEDKWEFTVNCVKQAEPFDRGTNTRAVEGTYSQSLSVDGDAVRTTTLSFDVVCDGDPLDLESALRPARDLVSCSVEVGGYEKRTLRARYTWIESDLGDGLLELKQTLEIHGGEDTTVRPVEFEGVSTILVYKSQKRPFIIKQTGSAVALKAFPAAQGPVTPANYWPSEDKVLRYEQLDADRYRTSWEYTLMGTAPIVGAAALGLVAGIVVRARGIS